MLPTPIIQGLPPAPKIVEIGVGGRFDLLEALGQALPEAELWAVDVDPSVIEGAPDGVHARVDDVREPGSAYRGADLLVARRPPAELQPAIARRAREQSAGVAIRALKDEWGPVEEVLGEGRVLGGASPWRWWPPGGF